MTTDNMAGYYRKVSRRDLDLAISQGLDVNAVDSAGCRPLHFVASQGRGVDFSLVEALVRAGAELDAVNVDGSTALHVAVSHGNLPVVQALVDYGADLTIENAEGMEAYELAPLYEGMERGAICDFLYEKRIKPQRNAITGYELPAIR